MLTVGPFGLSVHNHGHYRLDGGAMFGTVPRAIWSGLIAPDDENRIRLATRSLLIRDDRRLFLVDVGCGDKWSEKLRRIFGVEPVVPLPVGGEPAEVTDVILTHLHFDHAGGLSRYVPGSDGEVESCYPGARVHLQADNYDTARAPGPRERASYLRENLAVLERSPLELARGGREIVPGLRVHASDGHTRGLHWVEVRGGGTTVAFPSDLIPTSRHLPLPYAMGYDMNVERLLEEKQEFLRRAVAEDWIVVFVHDPDIPAARIKLDERGHYAVREAVEL
jgi:glyoxylase-like metal-dependent hydrolase (beta-lactamase superfamily II)